MQKNLRINKYKDFFIFVYRSPKKRFVFGDQGYLIIKLFLCIISKI